MPLLGTALGGPSTQEKARPPSVTGPCLLASECPDSQEGHRTDSSLHNQSPASCHGRLQRWPGLLTAPPARAPSGPGLPLSSKPTWLGCSSVVEGPQDRDLQ